MKKQYRVTVGYGYPWPELRVLGIPRVKRGASDSLALTEHQAWCLSQKHGVDVEGAPDEDPRPWLNRMHGKAEHDELMAAKTVDAEARRAGLEPVAVAELCKARDAELRNGKPKAEAPAEKVEPPSSGSRKRGGKR